MAEKIDNEAKRVVEKYAALMRAEFALGQAWRRIDDKYDRIVPALDAVKAQLANGEMLELTFEDSE